MLRQHRNIGLRARAPNGFQNNHGQHYRHKPASENANFAASTDALSLNAIMETKAIW
jgi:hypothetical protein